MSNLSSLSGVYWGKINRANGRFEVDYDVTSCMVQRCQTRSVGHLRATRERRLDSILFMTRRRWNAATVICPYFIQANLANQIASERLCHGFRFRMDLKLLVDAADVERDGIHGNTQLSGGGLVIMAVDQ